jgi:hypothetical protein
MAITERPLILNEGKKATLGNSPQFIRGIELYLVDDINIELTRTGIFVSAVETFSNPAKLVSQRVKREELTYTGLNVTQVDTFYYDPSDGTTVVRQVRDTLTYSGTLLTDARTVEII